MPPPSDRFASRAGAAAQNIASGSVIGMRESSIIPTNLLNWPRVAGRMPEEKLILLAVWAAPWLSCAGVGMLPLRPFAASLGLSAEATETGIGNLVSAGLLDLDMGTYEIQVCDWFRFHRFKTARSVGILLAGIEKIQSERIKNGCIKQSSTYLPTATATSTSTEAAAPTRAENYAAPKTEKKFTLHSSGIECWDASDVAAADHLAASVAAADLAATIASVRAAGKAPVPGTVQRALHIAKKRSEVVSCPPFVASDLRVDPAAQIAGAQLLPLALRNKIASKSRST